MTQLCNFIFYLKNGFLKIFSLECSNCLHSKRMDLSNRTAGRRSRLPPTVAPQKVELLNLEEYKKDQTMITAILYEEDHTVGNALKHIICQMPGVEFCGYNVPHPLEDKILVRIQTNKGVAAGDVLLQGLEDLAQIFGTIERKFKAAHRAANFGDSNRMEEDRGENEEETDEGI